ncbi:MAG TPA: hypothetical protein PKE15_12570, partial [Ottowia sp.]|nr:hypothetical protein [Ottowia sp.]
RHGSAVAHVQVPVVGAGESEDLRGGHGAIVAQARARARRISSHFGHRRPPIKREQLFKQ